MTGAPSPVRWAIDLSVLLNTVLGLDRFPVDVPTVAKEYSLKRYPEDPISLVVGDRLPGFDGALHRAPSGKKGWRYRVSLIAAVLRWLEYTNRRAVLVVSREGFILWARSSEPALKSGAFFRTSAGPIEIPAGSLESAAARKGQPVRFHRTKSRWPEQHGDGGCLAANGRVDITVHGFRRTFRDWAAESTAFPTHVVEMALAHTVGNKVEAAYRRSDLLAKRQRLAADWAKFCARQGAGKTGPTVIPIRSKT